VFSTDIEKLTSYLKENFVSDRFVGQKQI